VQLWHSKEWVHESLLSIAASEDLLAASTCAPRLDLDGTQADFGSKPRKKCQLVHPVL
jgi:hypothetical protein